MTNSKAFPSLVIAVLAISGCERRAETGSSERSGRPDSTRVVLEPLGDTIAAYRFESSEFSAPFVTFVPASMRASTQVDKDGESVTFSTSAQPPTAADGFVHLFLHPRGTDEARARKYVETYAASRGVPVSESESLAAPMSEEGIPPEGGSVVELVFPWAIHEVPYAYNCADASGDCAIGRVALGKTADRFYHVVVQYPPAKAPDFIPRAQVIISQWRWR